MEFILVGQILRFFNDLSMMAVLCVCFCGQNGVRCGSHAATEPVTGHRDTAPDVKRRMSIRAKETMGFADRMCV